MTQAHGYFFGGAGGSPSNPDGGTEGIGFGSGYGTLVAAATAANTKGAWVQLSASTAGACAGFWLIPAVGSSSGIRLAVDVSFDGGGTVAVPNIFIQPGSVTSGASGPFYFPLNIPAGADVRVRAQAGQTNGTVNLAILGIRRTAASYPLFNSCEAVTTFDNTTTNPTTPDITLANAWFELTPSTARAYGAVQALFANTSNPALAQVIGLAIGMGASGSEVELGRTLSGFNTATPTLRATQLPAIFFPVPSATRLAGRAAAATPGSDTLRAQVFGYY